MSGDSTSEPAGSRIVSIDALRGFVMFMMIFVNDLAGAPGGVVPDWMVHFSDRHAHGSGMTFVDLVFPAFLFIVGMAIPFALGGRLSRGGSLGRTIGHVTVRTLALLAIGILMVNGESPAEGGPGWSPTQWHYLMFLSAILGFCVIMPPVTSAKRAKRWQIVTLFLRALGVAGMVYCAITFQSASGKPVISCSPFVIHTYWYGILGIIGWSYFFAAMIHLAFRNHRTALLACLALLLCLYPAERKGFFDGFWLGRIFGIAEIGAHTAIVVAGSLLATVLLNGEATSPRAVEGRLRSGAAWPKGSLARAPLDVAIRFALLFAGGFAAAAVLLTPLYGISKNAATPAWCLWACAITALLWLLFYFGTDAGRIGWIARPLDVAGRNVLLAYLLSEMLPSPFEFVHFSAPPGLAWYVFRCAAWGVLLLGVTAALNRVGFRLKL